MASICSCTTSLPATEYFSQRRCALGFFSRRNATTVPLSLRIAVNQGEVAPFRDLLGHANYVGDGLNDCARLLSAKPVQSPNKGIPRDANYIVVSDQAVVESALPPPQKPGVSQGNWREGYDEFLIPASWL